MITSEFLNEVYKCEYGFSYNHRALVRRYFRQWVDGCSKCNCHRSLYEGPTSKCRYWNGGSDEFPWGLSDDVFSMRKLLKLSVTLSALILLAAFMLHKLL